MKIYLLSQNENRGYDTYDSAVVCAESEEDTKRISPNGYEFDGSDRYSGWARRLDAIECVEIGEANSSQVRGLICASFNAG